MAQKQPAKDAVSAAMSAIENALNLSGDGHEGGSAAADRSKSGPQRPAPAADRSARRSPAAAGRRNPFAAGRRPAGQRRPSGDRPDRPGARHAPAQRRRRWSPLRSRRCFGLAYVRILRLQPLPVGRRRRRGAPVFLPARDGAAGARRAGADHHVRRLRRPRPPAAGAAGCRPVRSPRSPCASPNRRRWRARTSLRSPRRSVARLRRWGTGSNARWRAPPSLKPWCAPRCRRSSAPIPTTNAASAR